MRTLYRGLSRVLSVLVLLKYLKDRCEGCRPRRRPPPRRPRPRPDCHPVSNVIYRRPDPLIYDQYYLTSLGLPVTWDNPDIHVEWKGQPVDPHSLEPATEYTIVARVWNASTNAPAIHLAVRFSYLSFGVGMESHPIGATFVDVGVKGTAACPSFAQHKWVTPDVPGHYCLQVFLDCPEDANPANNLGQTNTDVKPLNSPRATFQVPVRNGGSRRREVTLEANGYAIPPPVPCEGSAAPTADSPRGERERRLRAVTARHRAGQTLPHGWRVEFEPPSLSLAPGETNDVVVVATAPDDFDGRLGINVVALDGGQFLGGVTLYAEAQA